MATYKWNKGVPGDWSVAANWLGGAVPNGPTADVVIDAAPAGSPGSYSVTIPAGATETVKSLDLRDSSIGLTVNGTLAFAPGSAGALGREFESSTLAINNGTILNAGLMFTFIQTRGNVLFAGSNPIYLAWELQVVEGTATVDTASIAQYDAARHVLFDGAFEALGGTTTVNLGGKLGGFRLAIETLTGPKPTPTHSYWTQLTYDDPGSQINEWNGAAYVPVESTLKLIENAAYVTVKNGRGYTTANALTIGKDGVFEAAGGTISTGGLSLLNGALFVSRAASTGAGLSANRVVVNGAVANNGLIVAEGPGILFHDAIIGTGTISFNRIAALPGFDTPVDPAVAGTLEVGSVGAGQTVAMLGGDTLILDNPAAFAGTISGFGTTDRIVVSSAAAVTRATYQATGSGRGTLTFSSGSTSVGTVTLTGNYAGDSFMVTPGTAGASVTVAAGGSATPATDPLFDAAYYLAANSDVRAAGVDPRQHYLNFGWKEGRNPDAFFDTRYYLVQNPDVAAAKLDPLLHFELFGWKEPRAPSLTFSASKYLAANPDVAAAKVNPLLHYMAFGKSEGRMTFLTGSAASADPLVNAGFYDNQLGATLIPPGAAGQQQAAASYDAIGWQAGLDPSALFDTKYYRSHNPDVAAASINPLRHYEQFGWREGRDPSARFSTNKYLSAYSDVKAARIDPLLHYVQYGQAEGRTAFAA